MIIGVIPVNPAATILNQEMLQIVVSAIIIGLALLAIPRTQSTAVSNLAESIQSVCMKIVAWTMALAPVAVFGFLFKLAVDVGPDMLRGLGAYIMTVLAGLLLMLAVYMAIIFFVARRHPLRFLSDIRDAVTLAFSSSSSAATMPLSLETAEKKLKIREEISRLVIPLGTTVNMDGTALYQMIVAFFMMNMLGIDLSAGEIGALAVTIVGASIGSPGTPGVGLVILTAILAQHGVPPESIGIVLSVDRLLDMCRTAINVTGDLTAASVMDRWMKKKF
jgi:Na+/H+-dicarboxylate symporter